MQDKKSQYRGYLIVGLVITFLLVWNITYTDAQGEYPATLSSIQHESEDGEAGEDQSITFKVYRQDVPVIVEDHT